MDDLVVDGNADGRRVWRLGIAKEGRHYAATGVLLAHDLVEIDGPDAGLEGVDQHLEDLGHVPAGLAHDLDLGLGLYRDCVLSRDGHFAASIFARIAAVTSSTPFVPSMSTSFPWSL